MSPSRYRLHPQSLTLSLALWVVESSRSPMADAISRCGVPRCFIHCVQRRSLVSASPRVSLTSNTRSTPYPSVTVPSRATLTFRCVQRSLPCSSVLYFTTAPFQLQHLMPLPPQPPTPSLGHCVVECDPDLQNVSNDHSIMNYVV